MRSLCLHDSAQALLCTAPERHSTVVQAERPHGCAGSHSTVVQVTVVQITESSIHAVEQAGTACSLRFRLTRKALMGRGGVLVDGKHTRDKGIFEIEHD